MGPEQTVTVEFYDEQVAHLNVTMKKNFYQKYQVTNVVNDQRFGKRNYPNKTYPLKLSPPEWFHT